MYFYKDGMRFLANTNAHIKVGKDRTVTLKVEGKLSAGSSIKFNMGFKKVGHVKLNNFKLTPKIDYVLDLEKRTILFTFNLTQYDNIEIAGEV